MLTTGDAERACTAGWLMDNTHAARGLKRPLVVAGESTKRHASDSQVTQCLSQLCLTTRRAAADTDASSTATAGQPVSSPALVNQNQQPCGLPVETDSGAPGTLMVSDEVRCRLALLQRQSVDPVLQRMQCQSRLPASTAAAVAVGSGGDSCRALVLWRPPPLLCQTVDGRTDETQDDGCGESHETDEHSGVAGRNQLATQTGAVATGSMDVDMC